MSNRIITGNTPNEVTLETTKTYIAGIISELVSVNSTVPDCQIKLPPAPNGTVIYDSTGNARGSGKASLDLSTEVDSKYGDIAQDTNEAVARAFEGEVKNGDFRLGDNGDWTSPGRTISISNGEIQATAPSSGSGNTQLRNSANYLNGTFTIRFYCSSSNYVDRFYYYLDQSTYMNMTIVQGWNEFTFTCSGASTPKNIFFQTPDRSGATNVYSNFSFKKVEEEVVTERVDMFGLEQFDMVMKDDEIFDMVQSQSTTFGDTDVPTVDSVRPDSFFAVYDGQTGISKGKCVRWSTLTDVQKRKVAGYMKERLWVNEDGDLTFTTIRQRSIAGAGNFDWGDVDSNVNSSTAMAFDYRSGTYVRAQGSSDVVGDRVFDSTAHGSNKHRSKGVFTARDSSSSVSYKGRCFFYVLGTCSRLNSGAYHPSLNESGSAKWNTNNLVGTGADWHSTPLQPNTPSECFHVVLAHTDNTTVGIASGTGRIGGYSVSGRTNDNRLYDAIYSDGLGGVVDLRLSAYDMSSPEESAKAWEKVKNGTYRGLEKLVWTRATVYSATDNASPQTAFNVPDGHNASVGDTVWIQDYTDVYVETKITSTSDDVLILVSPAVSRKDGNHIVIETKTNLSVSGNFTMTDVIGSPENILQTPQLAQGWLGTWCPVIPDSGVTEYPLTRKSLVTTVTRGFTSDNGATWTVSSVSGAVDAVTNIISNTRFPTPPFIGFVDYTAYANMFTDYEQGDIVYGTDGNVTATSSHDVSKGCLVTEGTVGKVATSDTAKDIATFGLTEYQSGLSLPNDSEQVHEDITLTGGSGDVGVKYQTHLVVDNGQVSGGAYFSEMVKGSDWGGNSLVVSNSPDIMVDTNGTTIQTGRVVTALPIGWEQNTASFGESDS